MADGMLSPDGFTITITVPIRLRRQPGRKMLIAPQNKNEWLPRPRIESTLVKALARAQCWKQLMEDGHYATMTELAAAENVDQSYMARILRLTLLAPDIVESILDGRQTRELTLAELMRPFPVLWAHQRTQFRCPL